VFNGVEAIVDLQFLEDVVHVVLHRVQRERQSVGDLLIGKSIGEELKGLALARRELDFVGALERQRIARQFGKLL